VKVSIVLPCYNAEAHLHRSLDSLFAQTHPDLELIAVDDGSTDATADLLRSAAQRSPFPFTTISQANAGACAARNAGLKLSSGDYIQFMDADDRLLPEKVAHHAAAALRLGLPDVLVGSARMHAPDGTLKQTDIQQPMDREPWIDLARHRLGGTPNNLWKRDSVLKVGGWNEGLRSSQEYDLLFRLLKEGARLGYDAEPLTEIHERPGGSISQTALDRNWERFVDLRARILQHLRTTRIELDIRPFEQVLFDSIRTLYLHSPTRAVELYRQHFPAGFTPGLSPATGRFYQLAHRVLGFKHANRLRGLLR